MILLIDEDVLRPHLSRALAEHMRWLRANGLPCPAQLGVLLDALTDSNRPGPSSGALPREPVEPVLVDLSTAAARLSVSRRTVERMLADGRLASTPVGRRRLVPVAVLDAYAGGAA